MSNSSGGGITGGVVTAGALSAVIWAVVAHAALFALVFLFIGLPIILIVFFHPGEEKDTAEDMLDLTSTLGWAAAGLAVAVFIGLFVYVAATKP